MDANKIDMFFVANGKKLPGEKAAIIREKMASIDDSRYTTISSVEMKDPTTMLLNRNGNSKIIDSRVMWSPLVNRSDTN